MYERSTYDDDNDDDDYGPYIDTLCTYCISNEVEIAVNIYNFIYFTQFTSKQNCSKTKTSSIEAAIIMSNEWQNHRDL